MITKHDDRFARRRTLAAAGLAMVLLLAGCGSDGSDGASDGPTTTKADVTTTAAETTTSDEATTTEAETTTTAAPADDTVQFTETALGPISIGQTLEDAKATGWVGTDIGTCELAGTPPPGTYGFALDGDDAPDGLNAAISVVGDKVESINVRGGADMANDVTVEPFGEWTPDLAIKALTEAGYEITYESVLAENDVAKVVAPDGDHYELSLTEAGVDVAVPGISVCE